MKTFPVIRQSLFAAALALSSLAALPVAAITLSYNFDDGTAQGWTNVLTSPLDPPIAFEPSTRGDAALPAQSGTYRVIPQVIGPFSPTEDSHHDTLLFRSPEFTLGPSGSISLYLGIGAGGSASPGPNFATVAAAAVVPGSTTTGFAGVGLRRVSDGAYVLSVRKSANGINWENLTFSNAALVGNSLIGTPLTLDLIDNVQGGFGWVSMDTVTINDVNVSIIPEPSTFVLAGFGAVGLMWARRRRA